MFESRNEKNNERETKPGQEKPRDTASLPSCESARSLATEIPHTLTLRNLSLDMLERVLSELMPALTNLVTAGLFELVQDGRCMKGEDLRVKYFDPLPISIRQSRAFELSKEHGVSEQLHSIKIIDERCQPELPSLEIFRLASLGKEVSIRFSFDALSVAERWAFIEHISSMMGTPRAQALVETLPSERIFQNASGSSFFPVSSDITLETLSTLSPISESDFSKDRVAGPSRWNIESVEYSQPDYSEQSALLQLIDPSEFNIHPEGNLLSSLLLHMARSYATQEGEVSIRKLDRARKHIEVPVTVIFERVMDLGDPELDHELPVDSALEGDPDEELSAIDEYCAENLDEDSSVELSEDFELSLAAIERTDEPGSQDPCAEDIKDFGTVSRVHIQKRTSSYGDYRICFSSQPVGGLADQVNDDSFFEKDAPAIKVDFLDAQGARNRWRLLSKLHSRLAESMQVPEDEAHNLEHIEHDFSHSDVATSGDLVALYLGRVRVIASRG